jgi:inorganic triphosphatase YgiF
MRPFLRQLKQALCVIEEHMEKIENEVKVILPYETQAKFFPDISGEELNEFIDRIKYLFKFGGYEVSEISLVNNRDEYFDTQNYELAESRHSLRIRVSESGYEYTIKKPSEDTLGVQKRLEIEEKISEAKYKELKSENFQGLIKENIPDCSNKQIVLSAIVSNERRQFYAKKKEIKYKICLDKIRYKTPDEVAESEVEIELEIESKTDAASQDIDTMKRYLMKIFPEFQYANEGKYTRAVKFTKPYSESLYFKSEKFIKKYKVIFLGVTVLGVLGALASIISLLM